MVHPRKNEKNGAALDDTVIVSKAVIRAARKLEVSNVELSKIIGISEPQLSRIANEEKHIEKDSKEFELSLLFIRVFRSLDAIVGGYNTTAVQWIRNRNLAFDQVPIERIKTITGLVDVLSYLDSRRAPV
jgi:hypothetical protein